VVAVVDFVVAEAFEEADFGEVDLEVVLVDSGHLIVEVEGLSEELGPIVLCQDLQEDHIHIDIIVPIACTIDPIGGIIDLGIGDGGIHLGGQDITIDLGIIALRTSVEGYYLQLS
jgi:hypothetical protein